MASPGTMTAGWTKVDYGEIKAESQKTVYGFLNRTSSEYFKWLSGLVKLDLGRSRYNKLKIN